VVFLPAGRYRCNSTLYLDFNRDGITLRGAGAGTVIDSRAASSAISLGVASDYNWAWPSSGNVVSSGLSKGSSNITIGSTSAFSIGQIVQLTMQNSTTATFPVVHVSGFGGLMRQKTRVTGKTDTTLSVWPALYGDYSALTTKVNVAQLQTDFAGIEDLAIDCSNGSVIYGIQLEQAYACWIKGVRVIKPVNYAFFLYDSLNCEIRNCYADQRKTEGSNGAGVLCNTSSACLVEDNILYKFFPIIEVNHGSSGNVYAYNFCHDSTVFGGGGAAIDSNHGPHNAYNLYEGNVAANVQSDGYFGGASHDTIFRNWLHGTQPGISTGWTVSLNRFTRQYSLVGNILGMTGNNASYSFGNPNMGNGSSTGTAQPSAGKWWVDWGKSPGPGGFQEKDLDVAATTWLKGNYLFGAGVPSNESLGSDPLPPSLYRTGKPVWWPSDMAWPPFDPMNVNASMSVSGSYIPAQAAYYNNGVWPSAGGPTATPKTPTGLRFISQ
jgi:hypothetical protein